MDMIKLVQSGGFLGLLMGCEVDASALGPRETSSLNYLIGLRESQGFTGSRSRRGRDLINYDLEIQRAGNTIKFEFDESTVPDGARPLIEHLVKQAKPLNR